MGRGGESAAWSRGRPSAPGASREMLHALGLEALLEVEEEAPEELQRLAAERDEARAARDFARADEIRDQLAEAGWEIRDTPEGARLVRASVIVYGRNAVREALRGRRRVQRIFATERAAQEVWLGGVGDRDRRGVGARGALRLARPPGAVRRGGPVPVRGRRLAARPRRRARARPRRDPGPAQPRRDRAGGRERRLRRHRAARAARGRGHAGRLPGVRRRGGAPADRARSQHLRLARARRRSARASGCTGRRPRAA